MVLSSVMYTESGDCFTAGHGNGDPNQLRPYACVRFPQSHNLQEKFERTSRKPLMKFVCSLALGSSSARKYFKTCDSCFQKFRVSCTAHQNVIPFDPYRLLYLKLLMAIEQ